MSQSTAKSITDKVINMQRKTWERNYTKQQIYSIMNPGFTTTYIDKFLKSKCTKAEKISTEINCIIKLKLKYSVTI